MRNREPNHTPSKKQLVFWVLHVVCEVHEMKAVKLEDHLFDHSVPIQVPIIERVFRCKDVKEQVHHQHTEYLHRWNLKEQGKGNENQPSADPEHEITHVVLVCGFDILEEEGKRFLEPIIPYFVDRKEDYHQ